MKESFQLPPWRLHNSLMEMFDIELLNSDDLQFCVLKNITTLGKLNCIIIPDDAVTAFNRCNLKFTIGYSRPIVSWFYSFLPILQKSRRTGNVFIFPKLFLLPRVESHDKLCFWSITGLENYYIGQDFHIFCVFKILVW